MRQLAERPIWQASHAPACGPGSLRGPPNHRKLQVPALYCTIVQAEPALAPQLTPGHVEKALNALCYRFTKGPWRGLLIRRGYDPREDRSARRLQSFEYKLPPGLQGLAPQQQQAAGERAVEAAAAAAAPKRSRGSAAWQGLVGAWNPEFLRILQGFGRSLAAAAPAADMRALGVGVPAGGPAALEGHRPAVC